MTLLVLVLAGLVVVLGVAVWWLVSVYRAMDEHLTGDK